MSADGKALKQRNVSSPPHGEKDGSSDAYDNVDLRA